MKAILVTTPGGPDVLQVGEAAKPSLAPGDVLIQVRAAGVNRGDLLQRQGHYPPPPGASDIMGLEVSGTIVEVGADVDGPAVGDDVVALLAGGGYAEFVAVPAGQVLPLPPGVDAVTAAGIVEVAATVESNLGSLLTPGAVVLIHGGAGGIGTFAIQYAKARGCRVVVTAGSEAKLDYCREQGADVALDYHDDWVAGLLEKFDGGADVILDIIGAKYLQSNVKALAMDGTIVVIGLQGGVKGELNLAALLGKRGTLRATALRARPVEQKTEICHAVRENVWPLFASGALRPALTRVFDLDDVAAAHEHLASGDNVGKIVLRVS